MRLETRYIAFSMQLGETRWSGDWSIVAGELHVGSAYGCRSARLGRHKAENLARTLLLEILVAKLEGRLSP